MVSRGGCISSNGSVSLDHSNVKYCTASNTADDIVRGGGIFAKGQITISASTVSGNTALNSGDGPAAGGGVYALGKVLIQDGSVLDNNTAEAQGNGVAAGGAVFSTNALNIDPFSTVGSLISGNLATSAGNNAKGGGVFAANGAQAKYAQIANNSAQSTSGAAFGGGMYVADGELQTKYATISGNEATSTGSISAGGGVYARSDATIDRTTIAANTAQRVGGLALSGLYAQSTLTVTNSTISGNIATASTFGAGVYVGYGASIKNSTIAENSESNASDTTIGAGLCAGGGVNVALSSTIVSGNVLKLGGGGTSPSDVGTKGSASSSASLSGDHNFITFSNLVVPPDTIGHMTQAGLAPLADNGGPTKTHALQPGSQAIDAGVANGEEHDQRGTGYFRVIGPQADIGAFELGGDDIIFADGFENP